MLFDNSKAVKGGFVPLKSGKIDNPDIAPKSGVSETEISKTERSSYQDGKPASPSGETGGQKFVCGIIGKAGPKGFVDDKIEEYVASLDPDVCRLMGKEKSAKMREAIRHVLKDMTDFLC